MALLIQSYVESPSIITDGMRAATYQSVLNPVMPFSTTGFIARRLYQKTNFMQEKKGRSCVTTGPLNLAVKRDPVMPSESRKQRTNCSLVHPRVDLSYTGDPALSVPFGTLTILPRHFPSGF
jgi:hypothetical protein